MEFNPAPSYFLLLDINSCFATIEQQANPLLRGKPVAVAAYVTDRGCILAASIEAKRFGVKTGMRVSEGKTVCPHLIILPSDPEKYRFINRKLVTLLEEFTSDIEVKSIDEMVGNFEHSPFLYGITRENTSPRMHEIAREIKRRVNRDIGDWLSVSIGIAPNRYLAKVASGLEKPDGTIEINGKNIEAVLGKMKLTDLCGIKEGYGGRLRRSGITTPLAMYHAAPKTLNSALSSRIGYDWWTQLHGWDSDSGNTPIKTFGHSYALPIAYAPSDTRLHQILSELVQKMGRRMREARFEAQGVRISCLFSDHSHWNHGEKQPMPLFSSDTLYSVAFRILAKAPRKPVRILAVNCFALRPLFYRQDDLFVNNTRKNCLTEALDRIADRWGEGTVFPGRMLGLPHKILDRIAFGKTNK
ncbi:MAG: hypothetical protein Q7S76_01950 [bacterium]|nr:hypothetical protein [bacterium]